MHRRNLETFVRWNDLETFADRVLIRGHGDFSYVGSWRVIALARLGCRPEDFHMERAVVGRSLSNEVERERALLEEREQVAAHHR